MHEVYTVTYCAKCNAVTRVEQNGQVLAVAQWPSLFQTSKWHCKDCAHANKANHMTGNGLFHDIA